MHENGVRRVTRLTGTVRPSVGMIGERADQAAGGLIFLSKGNPVRSFSVTS